MMIMGDDDDDGDEGGSSANQSAYCSLVCLMTVKNMLTVTKVKYDWRGHVFLSPAQ